MSNRFVCIVYYYFVSPEFNRHNPPETTERRCASEGKKPKKTKQNIQFAKAVNFILSHSIVDMCLRWTKKKKSREMLLTNRESRQLHS